MSVLSSWQDQIAAHICEGSLTVLTYHGSSRKSDFDADELSQADIVLTTYDVISLDLDPDLHSHKEKTSSSSSSSYSSDLKKRKNLKSSPLSDICWWRIVLDEVIFF
jgi:SWI/SNF-related matrix-associated actin-dependent regulator of chromatin subfamily A3